MCRPTHFTPLDARTPDSPWWLMVLRHPRVCGRPRSNQAASRTLWSWCRNAHDWPCSSIEGFVIASKDRARRAEAFNRLLRNHPPPAGSRLHQPSNGGMRSGPAGEGPWSFLITICLQCGLYIRKQVFWLSVICGNSS